ncbi:hypothetical protein LTR56_009567 [Elasticomyces elasticus]|nr:hypothetical protein LTR56_009567 [Elasticomyces elasticus]KAK3657247.1 hypothetical protein LTR22_009421 [Elasticomyces elasticus]KAK4922206.1 hypothetical protein LTR49_010427 [Elasticomyces elasticus]KAK5760855.1 hypothetical protein LTS12_009031 [Elasticomyces elasticus]
MADNNAQEEAPDMSMRIIKALAKLRKTQLRVDAHKVKTATEHKDKKNQYVSAKQLSVSVPKADSGELVDIAERAFVHVEKRNKAVQSSANADTKDIRARTEQLAYRLIDGDLHHPELEKWLEPYNTRTVLTQAPKLSLTEHAIVNETPLLPSSEQFSLNGARVYTSLPWCPVIVLANDGEKWVEIRCPVCKANATPDSGDYMAGLGAMQAHLVASHGCKPMSNSQVLCLCKIRDIPFHDIRQICRDESMDESYVAKITAKADVVGVTGQLDLKDLSKQWFRVGWFWSQHPDNVIATVPCVVRHPVGRWFVLECPLCHGNSSLNGKCGYLSGPRAFYDHLCQGHGDKIGDVRLAAIIERCQVRELTDEEVYHLKSSSRKAIIIKSVQVRSLISKRPSTSEAPMQPTAPASDKDKIAGIFGGGAKRKASMEDTRAQHGETALSAARPGSKVFAKPTAAAQHHAVPQGRSTHSKAFKPSSTSVAASSSRDAGHPRSAGSDLRAGHDDESTVRSAKKRKVDAVELGDMVHEDEESEHLGGAESVRRGSLTHEPAMIATTARKDGTVHNAQVISDGEESEHLSDAEPAHSAGHVGHAAVEKSPEQQPVDDTTVFVGENEVVTGEDESGGVVLSKQETLAVPALRSAPNFDDYWSDYSD